MPSVEFDDEEGGLGPPQRAGAASAASDSATAATNKLKSKPEPREGGEVVLPQAESGGDPPLLAQSRLPSTSVSSFPLTLPHLSAILDGAPPSSSTSAQVDRPFPPSFPSSSGPLPAGVAAPASPLHEHNLRQIALYQSLAARQSSSSFPSFTSGLSPTSCDSLPLPPFNLPQPPPPTPALPLYGSPHPDPSTSVDPANEDADMPPASHKWHTNLEGLNIASGPPTWSASGPAASLVNITADELLAAQASLDLWASTSFSSPGLVPSSTLASPSQGVVSQAPTLPPLLHPSAVDRQQPPAHSGGLPASLDWSALYPHGNHFSPSSSASPFPLPPASSLPFSPLPHLPPTSESLPSLSHHAFAPPNDVHLPSSLFGPDGGGSGRFIASPPPPNTDGPSPPPTASSSSSAARPSGMTRRTSRANAGAKGRAARASLLGGGGEGGGTSEEGEGGSPNEGYGGTAGGGGKKLPRELLTAEEIEEDKRRRNTEASARFRAKKKMRDQELQQTSAQLRERVASLEKEKESLTNENRWLRDIVSEKAEVQPQLLDVLRRSSLSGEH
ncbi:hypothetical protein JCM8547_000137 [Rhodosporidiobolus lusitaniae]